MSFKAITHDYTPADKKQRIETPIKLQVLDWIEYNLWTPLAMHQNKHWNSTEHYQARHSRLVSLSSGSEMKLCCCCSKPSSMLEPTNNYPLHRQLLWIKLRGKLPVTLWRYVWWSVGPKTQYLIKCIKVHLPGRPMSGYCGL